MAKCKTKGCPLIGQREVPFTGNKEAAVVAIGESPGTQEVREGTPFYFDAPAGKLIRRVCREAGVEWDNLFIANSARCMIDKNSMSSKEITATLNSCRPKLSFALQALAPKAVVLWGGFALKQVLRRGGITKHRGQWIWSNEFNCWCMPTFHPAYVCRNQGVEGLLLADMKKVAQFIANGYEIQREEDDTEYIEIDSIKGHLKRGDAIGLDTETEGLDWLSPNFIVISYSVSKEEGKAFNIVLYEETDEAHADFSIEVERTPEGKKKPEPMTVWVRRKPDFSRRLKELRALLESNAIKKYMMNGGFDVHAFNALFRRERGSIVRIKNWVMDIQSAAHVLDENMFRMAALDDLQSIFAKTKIDYKQKFKDLVRMPGDMLDAMKMHPEQYKDYACADADITRQVAIELKSRLVLPKNRRLGNYVAKFVTPVQQFVLNPMEEHGIFLDRAAMPAVQDETSKELDTLTKKALKCVKKKVRDGHKEKGLRLTRDALLRDALFSEDGFGLEPVKKTKSKEDWSVDKEVMTRLQDRKRMPVKARELIETYTKWSELDQLRKKLSEVEKFLTPENRIHTHLSMVIAVTGRLSSSKPNLMNVPKRSPLAKKIRRLIAAPPGKLLLAADEEQNELRWLAAIADEKEMIRVFADGEDIHLNTAMSLISKPVDKWTPEELQRWRRDAKSINFGMIYGMLSRGFVKYAKVEYGIDLTEDKAIRWRQLFFRTYPGIPRYHKNIVKECKLRGYVESPLGRRRRLPEIYSENKYIAAEAARQAINHPPQSVGSDVVLLADKEIRVKEYFDPEECKDVLFIHDELIFEVDDNSKVEDRARIIKHEMENPPLERDFGYKMKVPLVAGVKVGKNLADMEELKL